MLEADPCPAAERSGHVPAAGRLRVSQKIRAALLGSDLLVDSMRIGLLKILHLNFECEPKCLSCLHILVASHRNPHKEPHTRRVQAQGRTHHLTDSQQRDCTVQTWIGRADVARGRQ